MQNRQISIIDPTGIFSDNFVDNFFGNTGIDFRTKNDMEMYEDGDNLIVRVKVPGFSQDNIEITVEDTVLTIKGTVKSEESEGKESSKKYYYQMREQSFARNITLPFRVNADSAEATFKDGIVTISLPKAEDAKPKVVSVKKS